MMAEIVYALCAFTSAACAVLLIRGFLRSRARLLLWSGICFAGLTANNVLLFTDKVLLGPDTDLSMMRTALVVVSLALLLYGLIWDVE